MDNTQIRFVDNSFAFSFFLGFVGNTTFLDENPKGRQNMLSL